MPKDLADLIAGLARGRAKQALRKQLVRGTEWRDGKRVETQSLLIGSRLVELTPEQIAELKEET